MSSLFNSDGALTPMGGPKRITGVLPSIFGTDVVTRVELTGGEFDATFDNLTVNGVLTAGALTADSVAPNITAKAGGGQDASLALSKNLNIVTTCATAGDSVTLPSAVVGLRITIVNLGAAALAVFPYTSDSINDAAADASVTIQPEATITFNCYTTVLWETTNESTNVFDKLYLGGDAVLAKETAHTISISDTTTANTAGGALTIAAGKGTGTAAGGLTTLSSGASTNATTTVAGNAGALTISGGTAGTATTGTGGNGGTITITGAAGGAASGAAGIGGNGAGLTITTGAGGASSSATGGAVGIGGGITITAGNGGAAAGTGVAGGAATACTITTGTGGASTHAAGGAGGAGAALTITAGNGGSTTNAAVAGGVGGAIAIVAGNAGAGSTAGSTGGAITITGGTGIGTAGTPGNITLTPGGTSSTTISPVLIAGGNIIRKPASAPFFLIGTTASDGAFAKSIVGGYVEIRGATGNVQLPTGAQITAAIGTVSSGSSFRCVFNAIGATPMTAGNTATITTNTNAVIDATVGATLMTVTGTSNVNIGVFRFVWDSANWIVSRI